MKCICKIGIAPLARGITARSTVNWLPFRIVCFNCTIRLILCDFFHNITIKNDGGTVTAHATTTVQIKDVASYVIEFNISGTNAQLRVRGATGHDVDWVAYVTKFDN